MTKTIFRSTFLVGILVLLLCAALFFGMQYTQAQEDTYNTLREEAGYLETGLSLNGGSYLSSLSDINRVTWIDAQGEVLYDSKYPLPLANEKNSPEVSMAFQAGEGQGIRKSGSNGEDTMYYARRCQDGTVLRLSRPLSRVRAALLAVGPMAWILVLVLVISSILAFRIAKQIVKPINELDLDHPEEDIYPELAPLVSRIQVQNFTIQEQIGELNRRQKEFSALTDSMQEGFLLIDAQGVILSANQSALRLAGGLEVGEKILPSLSGDLSETVQGALRGKRGQSLLFIDRTSWELTAGPIIIHGQISGAVLLIVDVTEREQREQLRREFSANVSHELKTPLTSISGFAELLTSGMAKGERVKEFAGDIYRESQRLIALVDDIIKVSRLDEEGSMPCPEEVQLKAICEDILRTLAPAAEKQDITMQLLGDDVTLLVVSQVLDEIIYNLCDNAIKYNKKGGLVTVTIGHSDSEAFLTVADTGIGIPFAHQSRVFERFYRVDKSHSKEIGGTGLGLSIVKHGAQYLKAKIEMHSKPGEGTSIRLRIPLTQEVKGKNTPLASLSKEAPLPTEEEKRDLEEAKKNALDEARKEAWGKHRKEPPKA